jgi:tetratricopeptide (TPR) repeat protein
MFRDNIAALFLLYVRPIAAVSRILDYGRLWFALAAAAAVCLLLHLPEAGLLSSALHPQYPVPPAARAAQRAAHTPEQPSVPPATDESDDAPPPGVPAMRNAALIAAWRWVGFMPMDTFTPLWATAIFLVPLIIFARAVSGFGSFPVLMRSDYLTILMCALLAWAAAYLPLAVFVNVSRTGQIPWFHNPVLFYLSAAYFAVLLTFGLRTALGLGFTPAAGLAALGWTVGAAGVLVSDFAGPMRFYALSPFLLYYGYALFASDVRSLGDGLRSRQNLRRQLEISTTNPRDADAHYQLGLIYQQRRQYTEAIARFQRAVEIDPSEAESHLQLGRIAREQGRFDDAVRSLRTAASLNEKLALGEVWRELGAAYFQSSHVEPAAEALARYTERRPYDPEGLYWYGKSLAALGRATEAKQVFEQCIEAVQTMPSHRRAHVRHWSGDAKAELRALR